MRRRTHGGLLLHGIPQTVDLVRVDGIGPSRAVTIAHHDATSHREATVIEHPVQHGEYSIQFVADRKASNSQVTWGKPRPAPLGPVTPSHLEAKRCQRRRIAVAGIVMTLMDAFAVNDWRC